MSGRARPPWADALLRGGVAVVSVGLALSVALWLWPITRPTISPVFLAAVMVSAWFGGLTAGLLATLFAGLAMDYFFLAPLYSVFSVASSEDLTRLGVFLLVAVLISALSAARHRTAAVLEDSRRFLQSTLDSLAAQIVIIDRDGVIVAVNDAWRRAAGAGVGSRYLAAYETGGGEHAAEVVAGIRDVLERRREAFAAEYRRPGPGEPRWLSVQATRFETDDGARRVVVAHENITERKRAEEAERAAEALRSVARLANAAAHEINNPLATIFGHLELLARRVDEDVAKHRIEPALAAVTRINEILVRMGDLTELRVAERQSWVPEMLDLRGERPEREAGPSPGPPSA